MLNGIITRLKEGRIKNVIPKGGDTLPNAPYVVVSIEGPELRVWVHFKPGQDDWLEDYWRVDLPELLEGYVFRTRAGNIAKIYRLKGVYTVPEYSKIVTHNTDKSISKERRFSIPAFLF